MTLLTTWPAGVNDLGDRKSGTVWSQAFNDAQKAAIEALIHSSGNPTISPSQLIDELVTARGSLASLDARLDVSLNNDGTLKTQASLASVGDVASILAHANWIGNDDFLIWAAGDAVAPTGYTLAGAGATVARTGSGLGDTTTKVGPYSVKLTRAAADASLTRPLLNSTSFGAGGAYLKERKFGFGVWVKCSVASAARVGLYDGVSTTWCTQGYHTGDGTWQWLSGTHTLSSSATELSLVLQMANSSGDAYFSGVTAIPGNIAPAAWVPCPKVYGALVFKRAGTLATGTLFDRFLPARPLLIKDVQLTILTAPATQAVIVDVNVWDGSAWQSMFTTKPQIAAAAGGGVASPDGTYRYRCLTGARGTSDTNALLSWDIDQVGSGTAGADLAVSVRALQYSRPQESLLDVVDI